MKITIDKNVVEFVPENTSETLRHAMLIIASGMAAVASMTFSSVDLVVTGSEASGSLRKAGPITRKK